MLYLRRDVVFKEPIHTLPQFRHVFGKVQNAFCQKSCKISARIQKPRAPHVKHDSRSQRRKKNCHKKYVFGEFVAENLRAVANSDWNRNLEIIIL